MDTTRGFAVKVLFSAVSFLLAAGCESATGGLESAGTSAALTAEDCESGYLDGDAKVTFCHREGGNDVGATVTTSIRACINAHTANHPDDYLGPCCSPACGPEEACRDGRCVPLDPCADVSCPWGFACQEGACVPDGCQGQCRDYDQCCGGQCVSYNDPRNCGRCGVVCAENERCWQYGAYSGGCGPL